MKKRTLRESAEYVCGSLKSFGLRVNASSRFARMAAIAHELELYRFDHPNFRVARQAYNDVLIFAFIIDQLGTPEPRGGYMERLRTAIADPTLPEDRPERTPGRDVQSELFMAAMCRKAGLLPTFEEPDIRCVVDSEVVGLAIKRPKGPHSVVDCIRAARSQIDRSDISGVIVVDMSVATDSDYQGINKPVSRDHLHRTIMRFFQERIVNRLLKGHLPAMIQVGKTIGLMLTCQYPYYETDVSDFVLFNHFGRLERLNDDIKRRLFHRFWERVGAGMPD